MRSWRKLATLAVWTQLAGCSAGESPEFACQKRLAAAREAPAAEGDSFNHQAYAKIERKGCSAKQLAVLDQVLTLTKDLPGLSETNEKVGASPDKAAHMMAFQRMNDAVIALGDLEQDITSDLAAMETPQ